MTTILQDPKFLKQLIIQPEQVIDQLDLVYINNDKLSIVRQKNKKGFDYLFNGKPLSKKSELERIKSLVIPPAWKNVRIAALKNGHLQAVGRDLKNRKQYRYHPLWNKIRNQTKFYKMTAFGRQLPKIRKKVDEDLNQNGWPKSKVLALIIRLLEETHIRVGNEQYAKRNKSYGLSTMRTKHVTLEKDKIKFEFVGKKGKKHAISLRNKKLIRLVNKCEEIPGWELFQYYDQDHNKHGVDSGMVNEYLHAISGELFTAKDFRTWAATIIFFETVMDLGISSEKKEIHKNVLKGFDAAAKELGNTRNVCRKYYVHPYIVAAYEDGSIQKNFVELEKLNNKKQYFSDTEIVVLRMLDDYVPQFLE